ncbi:MAG: HepT-like ribonuclease domain-containing protein [bacterium]
MKQNLPYLKHILDETKFLLHETSGFTYEDFISHELLKRGCTRSLEIIGEAVKSLSHDFKKRYTDIQWKKIAGMRDKIIHYYFGVNWDIVWDAIQDKIPELKEKIEKIIEELEK